MAIACIVGGGLYLVATIHKPKDPVLPPIIPGQPRPVVADVAADGGAVDDGDAVETVDAVDDVEVDEVADDDIVIDEPEPEPVVADVADADIVDAEVVEPVPDTEVEAPLEPVPDVDPDEDPQARR